MTKFCLFVTVSYDLNVITMSLIHMTLTFSGFQLFKTKFKRKKKFKNKLQDGWGLSIKGCSPNTS